MEIDDSYQGISREGLRRIYALIYDLAVADGQLDKREREILEGYRTRFGIEKDEARHIERGVDEGWATEVSTAQPELEMARKAMFQVAAADSHLAPEEEQRLIDLAKTSGFGIMALQRKLKWRGLSLSKDTLSRADLEDRCPTCGQKMPE